MGTLTKAQLRQNPSAALRAVETAAAEYTITDHGRPVARLVPIETVPWVRLTGGSVLGADQPIDPTWLAEWNADRDADRLRGDDRL
ncbi:type II toxin-antitoxin system prevent-host-death family antitoxin [Galbitalea sp. SE-J8]|uniref:type II toxin-antitoxin system Phd/YefM family antitoxin n=1 Tax=Galbitalea sp. SE-J8 TaxID=3054952 RepID=UPI00259C90FE|nr:type II toxin-antitoxin system prevent-host-death family antitoxin [Galbitalea sp. SE-J8]MDM4762101.1 type II toxin-antitoxin system prevent-host-death family antitoxin [Galbitalea sp. SE-J8]